MRTQFKSLLPAIAIGIIVLATSNPVIAEITSVMPYRPTVSNPADLPAPGWIEVEGGFNRLRPGDGSHEISYPFQVKFALSPDFGMLVGGDAFISQTDVFGNQISGRGDTTLLFKHHWALGPETEDDDPMFGIEWGMKAPTARSGLRSGKRDFIINAIYSTQAGGHTIDLNLNATRLGAFEQGTSKTQWGWAAAVSRPLSDKWIVSAEIFGTARHGSSLNHQALVALGYVISDRLVLDIGGTFGLNAAAPDQAFFCGLAFLLEKVR
jgi:hypothetical protein